MMKNIRIADLFELVDGEYELHGDPNRSFSDVRPVGMESDSSLVWISPSENEKERVVKKTCASVVLGDWSLLECDLPKDKTFLIVEDPRLVFARIMKVFFRTEPNPGIDPSSVVHLEARIAETASIGPLTIVGRCSIEANCRISGNVTIYDDVEIGKNVSVHSGTVLGVDGFGYARNLLGEFEKIEHVGNLKIGNDVEIFSNVVIARGTLITTSIGHGTKINNNVHIAHNVSISDNVVINAGVTICGSSTVGKNSLIGPGAVVRDGVNIGSGSVLGMGSVLTSDMPDGETWIGVPARLQRDFHNG